MRRRRRHRRRARKRRRLGLSWLAVCVVVVGLIDCHTPADTERAPTGEDRAHTYRSTAVEERPTLRPTNHEVGWLERHAAVARASSQACMECHQEEDCASCHTENLSEPFSVHPPNFEVMHAVDARLDMGNCTDCHKAETFCAACHVRTRVSAIEPNDPPARVDFHPPGWLDTSAPDNHAVAARRNIIECASCHQENDCVQCHRGVNPHPPEFRLNCSSWLQADPRACAKCHTDVRALRGRCL